MRRILSALAVSCSLAGAAGAATISVTGEGANDGYVKESGEGTGVGGYYEHDALVEVGDRDNDTTERGILSFDTSVLPTGAVIEEVTLHLRASSLDEDPFGELGDLVVDGFRGSFGADAAIASSDFEAVVGLEGTEIVTVTEPPSYPFDVEEDFTKGLELINDAGRTQLRLRFSDAAADSSSDRVFFKGGETSGQEPSLEITYRTGEKVPGFVPPDYEQSAYDVTVELPACDSSAHIIDDSETDWSNVPWTTKDVFCIEPGDYTGLGLLELDGISGTSTTKKVLRYYDPSDASPPHPVKRADASGPEAVIAQLELSGSDYWIIDGITVRGDASNMLLDSSNNVLNRILIEEAPGATEPLGTYLRIWADSDDNVVQNSVIRDPDGGYYRDGSCISLNPQQGATYDPERELENTRIVNNELINCNDGVITVQSTTQAAYYPGTVVENNDIYLTEAVYTKCDGVLGESAGVCACAENAIDMKGTVHPDDLDDASKRVKILNNRMWGYRTTDPTDRPGTTSNICGSGSLGHPIALHQKARNALIRGNVIWDSPRGISVGGSWELLEEEDPDSAAYVVNNLLYRIHGGCGANDADGLFPCDTENAFGLEVGFGPANVFYGNTVFNGDEAYGADGTWALVRDTSNEYRCNAVIDTRHSQNGSQTSNTAQWNAFHGVGPNLHEYCPNAPCDNLVDEDPGYPIHGAWTLHVKRWTGPETVTIPEAVRTKDTPELEDEEADCDHEDAGHPWN